MYWLTILVALSSCGLWYLFLQDKQSHHAQDSLVLRIQNLEEQVAFLTTQIAENHNPAKRTSRKRTKIGQSPKQERVLALHREGLDYDAIALETSLPRGQIELLVRLHGKD